MKTLIFNGSPRKNGDTTALIDEFVRHLNGEIVMVDVFERNIASCIDCRYCWEKEGCSQSDDMQEVYDLIQACDNILIASPVFFTELTGQLLMVASRLQTYFCARYFRKEVPVKKEKKGGILLIQGGGHRADKAADTAAALLKEMNAVDIVPPIFCLETDSVSPIENTEAMGRVKALAEYFNSRSTEPAT